MLKRIWRSLFGSSPSQAPFHDADLGELQPGESGWTVRVSKGADSFEFTIGGVNQPDAALLSHARDILRHYESFQRAVRQCVEAESRNFPEEVKAELAALEIDNISLFWPDRPDDGMVFFRGAAEDGPLWRCDYIARKPQGLGCDT
jgi:hypothetical protein